MNGKDNILSFLIEETKEVIKVEKIKNRRSKSQRSKLEKSFSEDDRQKEKNRSE